MKALRTPDERFTAIADYPFTSHYAEIDDLEGGKLRVHYLDEGPRDGNVVLLMHGEPSWSYLYRKMIPVLVAAGHRVIAPDLIGFGKSDKPTEMADYSYARHVQWMAELLFDHLSIRKATFFGQDWGGLIGLRLLQQNPSVSRDLSSATLVFQLVHKHQQMHLLPGAIFLRIHKCSRSAPLSMVGVQRT